jgi:hypothetical protein
MTLRTQAVMETNSPIPALLELPFSTFDAMGATSVMLGGIDPKPNIFAGIEFVHS